jgi:hypothetical protein
MPDTYSRLHALSSPFSRLLGLERLRMKSMKGHEHLEELDLFLLSRFVFFRVFRG